MVHIQREANNLADSFAKARLSLETDMRFYNTVSYFAVNSFLEHEQCNSYQLSIN